MIDTKVIIVGGGPSGSSCAWRLRQNGVECLVLDKDVFPRTKLCAGWITPQAVRDLRLREDNYPHGMIKLDRLHFRFYGKKVPIRTTQYSIRRFEFDSWLLQRSGAPTAEHTVREIKRVDGKYIIDDKYRCEYLVGAGGTNCPVYRILFKDKNPRDKGALIVAMEKEFPFEYSDANCYLWFFENKLPGYSWYVPKGGGYINIGIGGKQASLAKGQDDIHRQWEFLTKSLQQLKLIDISNVTPKGYSYYLRHRVSVMSSDKAYLAGDAAGLATVDMGEGIGPAVQSGLRAADSIIGGGAYSWQGLGKYSAVELWRGRSAN
ncbi:MAG: NAD(P)/FAD-dependent oxidoreductase [Leptospirales bacterium]|nr:NAD(P)/FAD-dependent oxidoreductase [Leptospirales bacterium]